MEFVESELNYYKRQTRMGEKLVKAVLALDIYRCPYCLTVGGHKTYCRLGGAIALANGFQKAGE